MITEEIKSFISHPRFNIYLEEANYDTNSAYQLYLTNIELSEALYPALSLLEISLRNAIHQKLKEYFNDDFWFKNKLPREFQTAIQRAERKIQFQQKPITADGIIAELNFGFLIGFLIGIMPNYSGNLCVLFLFIYPNKKNKEKISTNLCTAFVTFVTVCITTSLSFATLTI